MKNVNPKDSDFDINEIMPVAKYEKSKKSKDNVSAAVIRRLPRYFRYLRLLLNDNILRISSTELAARMNLTASQVRQDFNCFGGFGQQGYGYNVKYLYNKISDILGANKEYNAVIVGAGNLGKALASSKLFEKIGVKLVGIFDNSEDIIGKKTAGFEIINISSLKKFCSENSVNIAVLTVPAGFAHDVANDIAQYGISGIWNFTNTELEIENKDISVENVHLSDSLMILTYTIAQNKDTDENEIK